MKKVRIIVTGASGRMGRMLVKAIADHDDTELVGATERPGSLLVGTDIGNLVGIGSLGLELTDDIRSCPDADVIIDFSTPSATMANARHAAEHGIRMVIGTTGFESEDMLELKNILRETPTVMAANYSVGVNLILQLIRKAAAVLGTDYDAEIFEAHHRHKVDAPSGTALAMGRALAAGRKVELEDAAVYTREGITGPRTEGSIGFSVMRAGNIVGDHKAMFVSDEERVEIGHIASDRMVFARGAVRAAVWLSTKSADWYDMEDVLGLK